MKKIIFALLFFQAAAFADDTGFTGNDEQAKKLESAIELLEKSNAALMSGLEAMNEQNRIDADQNRNIQTLVSTLEEFVESSNLADSGTAKRIALLDQAVIHQKQLISSLKRDLRMSAAGLEEKIDSLNKASVDIQDFITRQNGEIENMEKRLKQNKKSVQLLILSLKDAESMLSDMSRDSKDRFQSISRTISQGTLYWIIAVLGVALLSFILFFALRIKLASSTDTLDKMIQKTKKNIDAEAVKLDSKLVRIMETQFDVISRTKEDESGDAEPDHSLPLKLGLEIHRMRKRIENMPDDTKGMKALKNSLKRLDDEYETSGYELVDLIGKPFVDGLTVQARFIPSDELRPNESIITKVIKPQINFKGVLIQAGEVEVSTGE